MTTLPRRSPCGMTICVSPGRRLSASTSRSSKALMRALDLVWRAFGRGRNPLALARDRPLASVVFAAFLLEALGLGFQIGGVVAFVGNAAAAVELENPAGDIVEEVAVVGDDQHGALVGAQVLFQPRGGLGVEMVGRLVEQQQVRLGQQQLAQRHAAALAARKLGTSASFGGQPQRFHRHLDLLFEVPEVEAVHLVLELRRLVGRLVGIVHHQLVVALDDGGLLGDAFHDVAEHGLRRIERRLLRQVADGRAVGEPGLAGIFLVEAGHDLQHGRLAGAVGAENADLGVGIEGEVKVFQNLLGAVGLVEPGHVIDELACHAWLILEIDRLGGLRAM